MKYICPAQKPRRNGVYLRGRYKNSVGKGEKRIPGVSKISYVANTKGCKETC